ncbi:AAA family ATPase [Cochlodiniinecator piscidefendens]|uniref:AAA family ATPase n=1 Tax=Cochlodiniinecator piscidefendens TaxID=2715756 RepID=UPI00140E5C4D|nr:AAA family ATPase [Cochlodiniinecator piscidefendens]
MSSILKLNRLVVMKSGQRAYDEKFHSGLNIIHGANGSGKSTILDFIFFALGENLTDWKQYAQYCEAVFAEISTNGTILTLKREVSKDNNRPMSIYFGKLEDGLTSAAEGWQRFPYARNEHSQAFSQILFKALGLPEIPGDEGSNITMHQILRLMYVDQSTPFQRIFRSEDFDPRDTREAVSELLCGIGNNELYSKRILLREKKKSESELGAKLTNLMRATSNLGENFVEGAFESETKNLTGRRETLQKEIVALHEDDIDSSKVAKSAENDRRKLYQAISKDRDTLVSSEREIAALEFEIRDSEQFLNHLAQLLKDFDRTAVTFSAIGDVPFELCPACLQPLTDTDDKHCHLCKEALPRDEKDTKLFELRMDIDGQIVESKRLQRKRVEKLEEAKKSATGLKSRMTRAMKQFDELRNASVDGRTALVSEKSRELGKIDARLDELSKFSDLRKQINDLKEAKERASAEVTKLRNAIEALELARETRRRVVKTEIASDTKRVLEKDLKEHNDFEALDNFDFSFEDDWFAINGDPIITTSASGMVVVKNSLFLGMLLASLKDHKMMYPRFLLLDNVEDKGMVGDRVRNFQKAIADLMDQESAPHQIIMTTSTLNPALAREDCIVGPSYSKQNRTLKIQGGALGA